MIDSQLHRQRSGRRLLSVWLRRAAFALAPFVLVTFETSCQQRASDDADDFASKKAAAVRGRELRKPDDVWAPAEGEKNQAKLPSPRRYKMPQEIEPLPPHDRLHVPYAYYAGLPVSPNGLLAALLRKANEKELDLVLWDTRTGKFSPGDYKSPHPVAFSPNGKGIACVYSDGRVSLRNLENGKPVSLEHHVKKEGTWNYGRLVFSDDGKTLMATRHRQISAETGAGELSEVVLWDAGSGKALSQFPNPEDSRQQGGFLSDDGGFLVFAIASGDPQGVDRTATKTYDVTWRVWLWDSRKGERITQLQPTTHTEESWQVGIQAERRASKMAEAGATSDGFRVRISPTGRPMVFARLPKGALDVHWEAGSTAYPVEAAFIVRDRISGEEIGRLKEISKSDRLWTFNVSADNEKLVALAVIDRKHELFVWDVSAFRKYAARERPDLPADEWAKLWAKLGDDDPREAFKAMRRLAASPKQTLPLLKDRLQPVKLEKLDHAALIAQLDGAFAQRQKAEEYLRAAGDEAIPFLEKALKAKPSVEAGRRMEAILKDLKDAWLPDVPTRRLLWSIEMLEFLGTPDAKKLLERLTEGSPAAWVTLEAKKSLDRLKK